MATYQKIASVSVGSGGSAQMVFSSIPATFSDLIIHVSARSSVSNSVDDIKLDFNGTTTNRSSRYLYGNGSTTGSVTYTREIGVAPGNTAPANLFGVGKIQITRYAGSNYKSISAFTVTENNATSAYAVATSAIWSNTAAITSIELSLPTGTFMEHSSADLYGIKNS